MRLLLGHGIFSDSPGAVPRHGLSGKKALKVVNVRAALASSN
jgi:hypothetical protein